MHSRDCKIEENGRLRGIAIKDMAKKRKGLRRAWPFQDGDFYPKQWEVFEGCQAHRFVKTVLRYVAHLMYFLCSYSFYKSLFGLGWQWSFIYMCVCILLIKMNMTLSILDIYEDIIERHLFMAYITIDNTI